ncbi:MAG: hypothetical protein C4308_04020 [Chitinophagaceae bacterium]
MKIQSPKNLNAYLVISLAAIFAYLPVSFMIFSLKNDVVVIEYPFQHFIAQSLRNSQLPLWFNSWAMGFPMQTVLTWGIYSTPQIIFGFIAGSNFYMLHVQFVFFIMLSGWGMFRLLQRHFLKDEKISLLLTCAFMLSGITVSSSQWLLYITCLSFIPWLTYCAINLFKKPSAYHAIAFAASYFLFFTNVHIYLSVVITYLLIVFFALAIIYVMWYSKKTNEEKRRLLKFASLGFVLTAIICAAPAYYTAETLAHLKRSIPIINDQQFFQENYLHPKALITLLTPLASAKLEYPNTNPVVLNVYTGFFCLLLLPVAIYVSTLKKNYAAWALLSLSVIFLVASFGHLSVVRNSMNVLPGFSYFRHPGVLRIYFLFFLVLFLAQSLRSVKFEELIELTTYRRILKIGLVSFLSLLLIMLVYSIGAVGLPGRSIYETVKKLSFRQLVFINAAAQFVLLLIVLFALEKRKNFLLPLFVADLILNTLICTPFFTISSYTVKEANEILSATKGFPVQKLPPSLTIATKKDGKNNYWYNVNSFKNEVSTDLSMPGPLALKEIDDFSLNDSLKNAFAEKPIAFLLDSSSGSLIIKKQLPKRIVIDMALSKPATIILQQAQFPGWKAYLNGKEISLNQLSLPFVHANLPAGKRTVEFVFDKKGVTVTAIFCHVFVLSFLFFSSYRNLKRGD